MSVATVKEWDDEKESSVLKRFNGNEIFTFFVWIFLFCSIKRYLRLLKVMKSSDEHVFCVNSNNIWNYLNSIFNYLNRNLNYLFDIWIKSYLNSIVISTRHLFIQSLPVHCTKSQCLNHLNTFTNLEIMLRLILLRIS